MRLRTDHPGLHLRSQSGFTMIIALGVMLVTAALLLAAFTAAIGDSHLSHEDTNQKQAYYAAVAGVQQYEYQIQANPDYWQTCEVPKSTALEAAGPEYYEVELLPASTAPKGEEKCNAASPFTSVIESKGTLTNTFRIKSTGYAKTSGYAGSATRSLVATFQVSGFLNYLYYTNYEQGDPPLFGSEKGCEEKYYSEWNGKYRCTEIEFTTGDHIEGPMHTNDAADVGGSATFGRKGHVPADLVEINGGTYPKAGCSGGAEYFTATKCYTKGATLVPPATDTSLTAYVEAKDKFEGVTHLVLNGTKNEISVTYFKEEGGKEVEKKEAMEWPKNGLIYVAASSTKACKYKYEVENADTAKAAEEERACGNVYVEGTYSKSLTVAGENDLIINGSVYPAGITLGSEPSGTAVLGLIASHYVRIYHPCEGGTNRAGSLKNPWIYAGILATSHSFVVDNYGCGAELGELHVYGAIAQNYRGAVGTSGGTGYFKDYKYDGRLAVDEPPYFLSPFKAGWKVIRQTAPNPG